ncbi:hypothetical protein Ancab_032948 [Ancistrocladus abbreviatus]
MLNTLFQLFLKRGALKDGPLVLDSYKDSHPFAEEIVRYNVKTAALKEPRMAASLLRLHSHDCFVIGQSLLLRLSRDFLGLCFGGANKFIPSPNSSLEALNDNFKQQGLETGNLVALSDNALEMEDDAGYTVQKVWAHASNGQINFTAISISVTVNHHAPISIPSLCNGRGKWQRLPEAIVALVV